MVNDLPKKFKKFFYAWFLICPKILTFLTLMFFTPPYSPDPLLNIDLDNNESDHFCGDGDGSKDGEWRLCKWVDSALKASQLYV